MPQRLHRQVGVQATSVASTRPHQGNHRLPPRSHRPRRQCHPPLPAFWRCSRLPFSASRHCRPPALSPCPSSLLSSRPHPLGSTARFFLPTASPPPSAPPTLASPWPADNMPVNVDAQRASPLPPLVSSPLTPTAGDRRACRDGGGGGGSPPPPLPSLTATRRPTAAASKGSDADGGSTRCGWASSSLSDESTAGDATAPAPPCDGDGDGDGLSMSMASSDVPAVFRADAASRYALFPIRHPALWEMYKKHQVCDGWS